MKKIAVIVINWNGEADSLACIEALAAQTQNHTVIAVDNGSTDNFAAAVEQRFPEVMLITNLKNLGFAGGANTGLRQAAADGFDWVALLNNDALPDKTWLEELVRVAESSKKIGIVTGKLLKSDGTIDSTGDLYTTWGLPYPRGRGEPDSRQYEKAEPVFGASGGASLYRTSMLQQIGLLDVDFFAYFEDVDLSFRAQLAGWDVQYTPRAVAHHKIGASSGKIKGFTTYQTVKNLPWLLWKNVPWRLMPKVWPRFFVAHNAIIFSALAKGSFAPVFKGIFMAFLLFPKKLWQRHFIQRTKKVSSAHLARLLTHDLPPNAAKLRRLRSFFS